MTHFGRHLLGRHLLFYAYATFRVVGVGHGTWGGGEGFRVGTVYLGSFHDCTPLGLLGWDMGHGEMGRGLG